MRCMDKIEILSPSLLKTERTLVWQFREVSRRLGIGLGWHYLLDLAWAARQLEAAPGKTVLDAGAGWGIMQWWLAGGGVHVISVDRADRSELPVHLGKQYRVAAWREGDLKRVPMRGFFAFLPPRSPLHWHLYPRKLINAVRQSSVSRRGGNRGRVYICNQDIGSMDSVPSNTVDGVVSISALEHNEPAELRKCVTELMRVLKPKGRLVATVAAAKERDWFHHPSRGWCFTESTLKEVFELPSNCQSNYDRYDEMHAALKGCDELRNNLADFYYASGSNGMPWGVWNPEYQPVGIVKIKGE